LKSKFTRKKRGGVRQSGIKAEDSLDSVLLHNRQVDGIAR
jgi:hypothetical protein